MSNSDYKLILVSDNTNKTQIRYRKKNDQFWNTIDLKEKDIDKIIDFIIKKLKPSEEVTEKEIDATRNTN